jgi:hypothetical protein
MGAAMAYIALVVGATVSQSTQTVRAAWVAMELMGWYVIVPLSFGTILTGLALSMGTRWGLFRHYWVLFSLVLTVFATVILLQHMKTVSLIADAVVETNSTIGSGLQGELLHSVGGLLVLLVIQILNVYKPRGMTPYGWRKQQTQQEQGSEQNSSNIL